MGYLSVYRDEQIFALTEADHSKRDVEQQLSRFSKKLTNLAVFLIWNNNLLNYIQSFYGSIPKRIKFCVWKKGKLFN